MIEVTGCKFRTFKEMVRQYGGAKTFERVRDSNGTYRTIAYDKKRVVGNYFHSWNAGAFHLARDK